MAVSGLLACSNIIVGLLTHSTSVVATGFEFAGDVLASSKRSSKAMISGPPGEEEPNVAPDGRRFLLTLTKEAPTNLAPAQMIFVRRGYGELEPSGAEAVNVVAGFSSRSDKAEPGRLKGTAAKS